MSEQRKIEADLIEVMREVKAVGKSERNSHQKFMFRGIDNVLNAVGPALRKHGVSVRPVVQSAVYDQVKTSNNKPATACRLIVDYIFTADDGSDLTTTVAAESWDHGDKSAPKAMSVAMRTALLQTLALPTQEPDPDEYSYEQEAQSREDERKADLQSWADNIMAFEKSGDWDKIEAGMNWARQKGDREKFLYAQGVLQRRPSPQEAQETAQQVLDAEVVTNEQG